ncbi:MAG TPA: dihydrofolate reductase family protein [Candidatus Angelobacter sp.]|nr:dihydrofolate reductase family protein [Candidatus Angelobacter sp.]
MKFEVLFDEGEPSSLNDPAFAPYGKLGFPNPPKDRPWTLANFVQSIDGVASFGGKHATGGDLAQSQEDQWLMGLLRAHADAILLGLNTLIAETAILTQINAGRGPVYKIEHPELRELRQRLGRQRESVILVTASARFDPAAYRLFDGDEVQAFVLTTATGASRLAGTKAQVIVAGKDQSVDLPLAVQILRRDLGVEYLLCEGGPTLYGNMAKAGLIDEKFVTVAPREIGLMIPPEQETADWESKNPPRLRPTTFMAPGFTWETSPRWRWISCRRSHDFQFSRYRLLR